MRWARPRGGAHGHLCAVWGASHSLPKLKVGQVNPSASLNKTGEVDSPDPQPSAWCHCLFVLSGELVSGQRGGFGPGLRADCKQKKGGFTPKFPSSHAAPLLSPSGAAPQAAASGPDSKKELNYFYSPIPSQCIFCLFPFQEELHTFPLKYCPLKARGHHLQGR